MSLNRTQLINAINDCYAAKIPLLITGKPGIGKTDIIDAFAVSAGVKCHPFNAATFDPSTFGIVIPRVDNSACDIVPTAEFIDPVATDVVFFDEMDKLEPLIQNTVLPLIQNHRLHAKKVPDYWFVLAGNGTEHGGTHDITGLIRNRCVSVEYEGPTAAEWLEYADTVNIDYRVKTFIESKPELLNNFSKEAKASATHRQWVKVSKLINSRVFSLMLPGIVGAKAAAEFEAFIQLTIRIPSWNQLLAMPNYIVPTDHILKSILSMMIATNIDGASGEIIINIIRQLDSEFVMMILRKAASRKAPGIAQFITRNNFIAQLHASMI